MVTYNYSLSILKAHIVTVSKLLKPRSYKYPSFLDPCYRDLKLGPLSNDPTLLNAIPPLRPDCFQDEKSHALSLSSKPFLSQKANEQTHGNTFHLKMEPQCLKCQRTSPQKMH